MQFCAMLRHKYVAVRVLASAGWILDVFTSDLLYCVIIVSIVLQIVLVFHECVHVTCPLPMWPTCSEYRVSVLKSMQWCGVARELGYILLWYMVCSHHYRAWLRGDICNAGAVSSLLCGREGLTSTKVG